jgi:hypothetical protein
MSIEVTETAAQPKYELAVVVRAGRGETRHTVTLDHATFARLAGASGASPTRFVEAVFEFLLEREPKESILPRFDVTVVSRYFPEFDDEIAGYL